MKIALPPCPECGGALELVRMSQPPDFVACLVCDYLVNANTYQKGGDEQLSAERDALQSELNLARNQLEVKHGQDVAAKEEIATQAERAESELSRVKAELGEAKEHVSYGRFVQQVLELGQAKEALAAEQASGAKMREALGMGEPYNVPDVLLRLADAADHLLRDHSCDAHGHEGTSICAALARKMADDVRSVLSTSPADALNERLEVTFKEAVQRTASALDMHLDDDDAQSLWAGYCRQLKGGA